MALHFHFALGPTYHIANLAFSSSNLKSYLMTSLNNSYTVGFLSISLKRARSLSSGAIVLLELKPEAYANLLYL